MTRLACIFVLAVAATAAAPHAHANDKEAAKEHFQLAKSAEQRDDWRTAITEYELAYAASPHPVVLFNIGNAYEKLGQGRNAATYFRRYLEESPEAEDRARVETRIETLRTKPSEVEIRATPAGAVVFVDGERRGEAPLTLEIDAGEHEVYVADGGRTSAPRAFTVEFGDPHTMHIDLDTSPGMLIVSSDVSGAEVRIDGDLIGYTPFSGPVAAGEHQLLVSKPGYQSMQRDVDIRPQGSVRINAKLAATGGGDVGGGGDGEQGSSTKYFFGMDYGLDVNESEGMYRIIFGLRGPSDRWDAAGMLGTMSASGAAYGLEGRVFALTGRVRPYARAAVHLGSSVTSSSDRALYTEGGLGLLIVGQALGQRKAFLEYFVEVDVAYQATGFEATDMPEDDPSRVVVPIMAGLLLRYGN